MDMKKALVLVLCLTSVLAININVQVNGKNPLLERIEISPGDTISISGSISNPSNRNVTINSYRITTRPSAIAGILRQMGPLPFGEERQVSVSIPPNMSIPISTSMTLPAGASLPPGNYDLIVDLRTSEGAQQFVFQLKVPARGIIGNLYGFVAGIVLWIMSIFFR